MAVFVREDGVSISTTDLAPAHFMFKIQSLSKFKEYKIEKYTSTHFDAGGYKWKLIFYPNGNKSTDHISMHLAVAETCCFLPGWEIHAVFRLFLLDQYNDTYLVVQDAQEKGRRFRATRTEWGFDRIITLKTFNDTSYGYLVDDSCVFGAEVYVHKELKFPVGESRFPKGECLSMVLDPDPAKFSWTINNFFEPERPYHESSTFQQWKMRIYPKGMDGKNTHISLSLHNMALDDEATNHPSKIHAEFTLHLLDTHHHKNKIVKGSCWFSPKRTFYEWPKVLSKDYFKTQAAGFWSSSKDKCTIEAEVRVHGVTNALRE